MALIDEIIGVDIACYFSKKELTTFHVGSETQPLEPGDTLELDGNASEVLRMKKLLLSALFVLGISANTIAQAVIIDDSNAGIYDGTDVGAIDTLLEVRTKADYLASGLSQIDFELDLINDHATTTYTYNVDDYKTDDVDYYGTDTANVYAFGPANLGDFFIVKNSTFWALFLNHEEFDWGVILASVLPDEMNIPSDPMTISHVTATPVTTTVPEPSLMLLMGTGLIGFGFARRKTKC